MDHTLKAQAPTLVTVAIPVYNGERYIREAIEGVLAQSFGDFKLLIINDASTDGTLDALKEYTDPRIKLVNNEKNLGGYPNFNKCLALATGKYIFFNHQDDIMMPNLLEKVTAVCEGNADIACCGVNALCIDENSTPQQPFFTYTDRDILFTRESFLDAYFTRYSMAISSTLLRMDIIRDKGLRFSDKEGNSSDMVFWVRLALCAKQLYFMHTPLFYRRLHSKQWSASFCTRAGIKNCFFKTYMNIFSCILDSDIPTAHKVAYINVYLSQIQNTLSKFPSSEQTNVLKKVVKLLTSLLQGTPLQLAKTVLKIYPSA